MSLKSDKLPNKALSGSELKEIITQHMRGVMDADWAFGHSVAYRRVAFTVTITCHLGQPIGEHVVRSRARADGVVEGEAPLVELCKCGHHEKDHITTIGSPVNCSSCDCAGYDPEDAEVVAVERSMTIDNPNLARIHHDLPVRVQESRPPVASMEPSLPGEPPQSVTNAFPDVITHELRYDKTDAPPMPPPVDRDVSESAAARMGAKARRRV